MARRRQAPRAQAEETRHRHLAYLDGARALAASYVVFDHARLTVWASDYGHNPSHTIGLLTNWTTYGHFAVAVFIVLSGYCLTLPVVRGDGFLRGGALRFFKKRARRILPPFYFAALLSLILIWTVIGNHTGTHWDRSIPVDWHGYVGNFLLLQNMLGQPQINHAFWSIAVEWQIYFLFPLLLLAARRYGVLKAAAGGIVLAYFLVGFTHVITKVGPFLIKGATAQFLALFVLGMVGAYISFSERPFWRQLRDRVPWAAVAAAIALVTLAVSYATNDRLPHLLVLIDFPVGLAVVAALVAASRPGRSRIRSVLAWRPLAFLGAFSYSLYLVHPPLLQVEWQYGLDPFHLGRLATYLLLIGVGIPLIVAATYVFHLVCERPFMSTKQRRASEGEFADLPETRRSLSEEPSAVPVFEPAR